MMNEIQDNKRKKYLNFLLIVEIAAEKDSFINKIQHKIKKFYLSNYGVLSVRYLLLLARSLKNTKYYQLLQDIEIDINPQRQQDDFFSLSVEEFDLISISLTDDQKYAFFSYRIDGKMPK